MSFRLFLSILAVCVLVPRHADAALFTLVETEFSNSAWTQTTYTQSWVVVPTTYDFNVLGSSTAAQSTSTPIDGPYRRVTTNVVVGGDYVYTTAGAVHIYTGFAYDPAVSGTIGTVDYSMFTACFSDSFSCSGQGQAFGLVIRQGGVDYAGGFGDMEFPFGWLVQGSTGLQASDFGRVGAGPNYFDFTQNPNFSSGAMQFGFWVANGGAVNYSLEGGYDDFTVSASEPAPVPEPATLLLVGAGAGVLAARRRRR